MPTLPGGVLPAGSILPSVANWFSPAIRGLLALAPPPPPPPPPNRYPPPSTPGNPFQCLGIPGGLLQHSFYCGRCAYSDSAGWLASTPYVVGNLVVPSTYNGFAFRAVRLVGAGITGSTEPFWPRVVGGEIPDGQIVWRAEPEPLCGFVDTDSSGEPDGLPLPLLDRGFDDPQADPDLSFTNDGNKVYYIRYTRADIYDGLQNPLPPLAPIFPYQAKANDADNGNPPWGSQPNLSDPSKNDNDADGQPDPNSILDRNNRGAYAAFYNSDRFQRNQQKPNDAFAAPSHPAATGKCLAGPNAGNGCISNSECPFSTCFPLCDIYAGEDCGGLAHFPDPSCTGAVPCLKDAAGKPFLPYPALVPTPPPAPGTWPLVPFHRDWVSTDGDSVTAIKRLLRFASSIVGFEPNPAKGYMFEYDLREDSNAVVMTAPGTPLAGSLKDAYDYFFKSVFHENKVADQDDPYVNCRVYKIVLITDGLDSSSSDPCTGGPTNKGPAGDLGALALPSNPGGARALAHAIDPNIPIVGVPVVVVALGVPDGSKLQCIADNSGGKLILANDRQAVIDALKSVLDFQTKASFAFASAALPAFASSAGDAAVIGGVIPSHANPPTTQNPSGAASIWAVWNGSLKAYRLDANGDIPTVTATAVPTLPPGTPTPTPGTQSLLQGFPDENTPDDTDPTTRRPVWNAARVLGYTDPATTLTGAAAAANPVGAVSVWPGRKMVWADNPALGAPAAPLPRQDFSVPDTNNPPGTCGTTGNCFIDLIKAMGLDPTLGSDVTKATRAVQFLRGGKNLNGSRDEILTDLGTYGSVTPGTKYSYIYQDDRPGGNSPTADTAAYPHKLGDIFHSEPTMLLPPKRFAFLSSNVTPRSGLCGALPDCSYVSFALFHQYRRRVVFVGSNDGFFHAFDAGVWDRDTDNSPQSFDLGTGQELFAYAPKAVMNLKFPNLLKFPPEVQYFVDGSPALGDAFIGPTKSDGSADPPGRTWKTVAVSGLRQGGRAYFALDVTQPDQVKTDVPTTDILYGSKTADKESSPDCLDGGGTCAAAYPTVLWELADDCAINGTTCVTNMGETWSRPVVGRIQVLNGAGAEDRYVAIFGGGFDPAFKPGTPVGSAATSSGRAIYIVDVERGKVIYKATQGKDDGGTDVRFAPMPAPPAVGDVNDDGYLDVAYFGDLNGRMWRLDLTPDSNSVPKRGDCAGCGTSTEAITGYQPFLLYDAMTQADLTTLSSQPIQPIFLEPSIIFISGGQTPTLGVAFGTGYRAELIQPNLRANPDPNGTPSQIQYANRFHFVVDSGGTKTLRETDLVNITPSGGVTPAGTGPAPTNTGYFLDFASLDEKAVSTVFSTRGNLTLVTFTPSLGDPCSNTGSSFRYRFFFLTGQGGVSLNAMGTPGVVEDYRETLGRGLVAATQSQSPEGVMIDTLLFGSGAVSQQNTSFLKTNAENWKEQQ